MKTKQEQIRAIKIENLLVDIENPRYDPLTNQREAIATIAKDQGPKLANLAEDIVDRGLNPSELPIITPSGSVGLFIVLEGNRRIAAIKLLLTPALLASIPLPDAIRKRFKAAHDQAGRTLEQTLNCVVLSRDEANHWIELRHTGENEGVGVVPWDGIQTHRFRGASPAFHLVELVKESGILDEGTLKELPKISITNIERILGTPEARKLLGVNVKARRLVTVEPDAVVLPRLARVVRDVAHKRIKVSNIETKADRIAYARSVAEAPLTVSASKESNSTTARASSGSAQKATKTTPKRVPLHRNTVIPRSLVLTISQPRLNKIYHELQEMKVDLFLNSCAVMLRVFLELTIDDFAKRHKISLKEAPKPNGKKSRGNAAYVRDMTLRQKLTTIADFLEKHGKCTSAELMGVRTIISNRHHVLSVNSLNAYVHNQDYNPTASDIKTTWDNLQVFVERVWTY